MKSIATIPFLIAFLWVQITPSFAQKKNSSEGPNLVKINVTSIPLSNFSFQYERALTNKISGAVGLRIMPKSNLPFSSAIEDLIDDEEAWRYLSELKISNFAITPEVRFYLGKEALRGFYVAPFVRFANYSLDMPFEFDYQLVEGDQTGQDPIPDSFTSTIPIEGNVTSITGGLMLGAQFKIAKMVYLDWWILGPHYGNATGDLNGKKQLSNREQEGLRESLEGLGDLDFVESYEVDAEGARVRVNGPWGGIRAGLAVGFRF